MSTTVELQKANERYQRLRAGIEALCDAEDERVREINERLTRERGETTHASGKWWVGGILPIEKIRALLDDA